MAKNAESDGRVLVPGAAVFIRTVTHYYTGRVLQLLPDAILLEEAAWVADTGRFAAALRSGTLHEVEPYPGLVEVMRGVIVDAAPWDHELPRSQK